MTLAEHMERYLPAIEEEMKEVVQVSIICHEGLCGMLQYHLGWVDERFNPRGTRSGKRVRPVLCLLSCEAAGGDWEQVLPGGAAVELMHNFSLIHDDIEDRDHTRRGRPTVWSLWGVAQGVNAGDTLFALSQLALMGLSQRGVPAPLVVEAMRVFNNTCVALTSGQYLDISFESRAAVSVAEYLKMIEGKTGALISAACEIGAIVAEAPPERREQLRRFGYHLGRVFQMRDDILGIWGDPAVTGKPVGSDILHHKKTLPIVHGMERSRELRDWLGRAAFSEEDVLRATEWLVETGSREYTEELAQTHYVRALSTLEETGLDNPAVESLRELAYLFLTRDK